MNNGEKGPSKLPENNGGPNAQIYLEETFNANPYEYIKGLLIDNFNINKENLGDNVLLEIKPVKMEGEKEYLDFCSIILSSDKIIVKNRMISCSIEKSGNGRNIIQPEHKPRGFIIELVKIIIKSKEKYKLYINQKTE